MKINGVILCAGKGTRMKSSLPKVVHKVGDYEMVNHVLSSLNAANVTNNTLVLGYKKEDVLKRLDPEFKFDYVIQEEQLGTGHAVEQAKQKLAGEEGITIVTYGDTPLVSPSTYENLLTHHYQENNDLTVLTAHLDDASGYGRIIRDEFDNVVAIVEQKDANEEQQKIQEFNTGIYCFDNQKLFKHLSELENNNAQEEYYLTDLVKIFNDNKYHVGAYQVADASEVEGVNDLVNLAKANKILQKRINTKHLINGVNIIDPYNTYISPTVIIGEGTTIEPNNKITGKTIIGKDNYLDAGNVISDSIIGNNNKIGPNAHLRDNVKIADDSRFGNYVELKNSSFANNVKAAHLTYIGDSDVGSNINFGCGVITVNYDGQSKFNTKIGNNVFIGSNVNLIAPLTLEDNVFIAAGTTVTQNIEENKFVIDRTQARIKNRR